MSWTDDRVSLLKRLWGEGRTAAEIAKELGGVTRNAVIGKAHRLKLSGRVSPIQQNNKKPIERKVSERVSVVQTKSPSLPEKILKKPANSQLYSLMDLKPRACRWPVGDPKEAHFGFCGENSMTGLPYCAEHAKLAYQAATRNRILKAEASPAAVSDEEAQKKVS